MTTDAVALETALRELDGHVSAGVAPFHRVAGWDPSAPGPLVHVRGRRARRVDGEAPEPWPPAGVVAALHDPSRVKRLLGVVECREGEVSVGWAVTGSWHLDRTLASALGADLVAPVARPQGPRASQGCLVGLPSPDDEGAGVDALIAALPTARWSFLCVAEPVPRADADARFSELGGLLRRVNEAARREPANPVWTEGGKRLEAQLAWMLRERGMGLWRTAMLLFADDEATLDVGLAALAEGFHPSDDAPRPLRAHRCVRGATASPLDNLLGPAELARVLRLPSRDWPGFRQVEEVVFDLQLEPGKGRCWAPGPAMVRGAPVGPPVELGLDRLVRHALVAGVTGSGKTNTVVHLLDACARAGVPFLVVEPVKTEYRRLLALLPPQAELRVFTAGVEIPGRGWPLRLNPLAVPPGVPPGTWLDGVLAIFSASFVLYPPMPHVLAAALRRVYEDAGWDLVGGGGADGRPEPSVPSLDDLVVACDAVIDGLGYDRRIAADLRAALRARLGALTEGTRGPLYATGAQVSDTLLFERPCVVELDALPRAEDKAFAMGLLVLRLSAWRRHGPGQGPRRGLRHLLVLEEAHRLLRRTAPAGGGEGEGGNPRAQAVEQLTDLLSEVRAYGQGVLVVDQIPSRLAEDAVKNTDLKVLHRLVADDDRALVGGSAALDEAQRRHLVTLQPGEVVLFQEPMDRPVLARVEQVPGYDGDVPRDEDVYRHGAAGGTASLPKPFGACQACPRRDEPCGDTLGAARRVADGPLATLARARALALAAGARVPPLETAGLPARPRELPRCAVALASARAARRVADETEQPSTIEAAIARTVVTGGVVSLAARGRGPLVACAHCPAACRWRPAGARLARPDAWATLPATDGQLGERLEPLWSRVAAWAGPVDGSLLAPAVYCAVAHELSGVLPSFADSVARATARLLGRKNP